PGGLRPRSARTRVVPRRRIHRGLALADRRERGPQLPTQRTRARRAPGRPGPAREWHAARAREPGGGGGRRAAGAAAVRPLPPLLRRPRLPDNRRGTRDRARNRGGDVARGARVAAAPPRRAGGRSMTERITSVSGALELLVPPFEDGGGDWAEILERAEQ